MTVQAPPQAIYTSPPGATARAGPGWPPEADLEACTGSAQRLASRALEEMQGRTDEGAIRIASDI
ncbi:MAG: hypothetical protein AB1758_07380 [Candidatus Eremiobacterota bacterium]